MFLDYFPRTMSVVAFVICATALSTFMYQFDKGVSVLVDLLETVIFCHKNDYPWLHADQRKLMASAGLTMCQPFVVIITDILRQDARYSQNPICQSCTGSFFLIGVPTMLKKRKNILLITNTVFCSALHSYDLVYSSILVGRKVLLYYSHV